MGPPPTLNEMQRTYNVNEVKYVDELAQVGIFERQLPGELTFLNFQQH